MKTKGLFVSMLALILLTVVSVGCGTATQATPAPSVENAEPAATQVDSPVTLTDISGARISLDDLPEGFEEIDMQGVLQAQAETGDAENMPDVAFAFINKANFQVITGMNYLLVDAVDRIGFGAAFRDSKESLQDFAGALGGTNVREVKTLYSLKSLGDKREAITMLSDVEGVPMRVDAVMFQRGDVGSILITMKVDGEPGGVSIQNLGSMLDQYIQESLGTSE